VKRVYFFHKIFLESEIKRSNAECVDQNKTDTSDITGEGC